MVLPDLVMTPFTATDVHEIRREISGMLPVEWNCLPNLGSCTHPYSDRAEFTFYNYYDAISGFCPKEFIHDECAREQWFENLEELLDELGFACEIVHHQLMRGAAEEFHRACKGVDFWTRVLVDDDARLGLYAALLKPAVSGCWTGQPAQHG